MATPPKPPIIPTPFKLVPRPEGLDWRDWVDNLVGYNPILRAAIDPNTPWQMAAERLAQFEPRTPRPDFYPDWRDWVYALKSAVLV